MKKVLSADVLSPILAYMRLDAPHKMILESIPREKENGFFTYLLVCFTLFAEDGCYLGTGTGSGCKNFPLRLHTLRF